MRQLKKRLNVDAHREVGIFLFDTLLLYPPIGILSLLTILRLLGLHAWWPVALYADFMHWLLPVSAVLLVMALLRRQWYGVAAMGGNLLAYVVLFGGLFLPAPSPDCPCITVMTYNVGYGRIADHTLVEVLREADTDIVGLQEVNARQAQVLRSSLSAAYPHIVTYQSIEGTGHALLSRYPIHSTRYIDMRWQHVPPYLRAVVDVEGKPVSVFVFRARSPRLGEYPRRAWGYQTWNSGDTLAPLIADSGPAILLADLNTSDQGADYLRYRDHGLVDAHRIAGTGYGLTFPAAPSRVYNLQTPLVRIDYVLVTPEFGVVSAWRGPDAGSDHLAVIARLSLPP